MSAFEDVVEAWGFRIAGDKPVVLSPACIAPDGSIVYSDAESFRDLIGAEPELGNPSVNGWILSSSSAGVRSWVAPNTHSHAIADVTGLQTALDARSLTSHNHNSLYLGISATAAAATKLATARTLTIGGTGKTFDGSANVSWSLAEIGAQPAGSYAAAVHAHAISDVTGLQSALDGKEPILGNPSANGRVLASTTAGVRSWVSLPTIPVASVFGRTGAVVAASGDYTTAQVTESGNLYYTDARARAAISASAPLSYSGGVVSHLATDGNLHVPATSTTNNGKALVAGSTAGSIAWTSLAISHITGLQSALDAKLSTVTADASSRAANTVYAAPNGSAGTATFRSLVAADIPSLDTSKLTSGTLGYARGGTGISAPGATAGNLRWSGSAYAIDTASYALSSAIPVASSTTPSALGTASVGTGATWARADHVHAMPTAAQVGAAAASHNHDASYLGISATAAAATKLATGRTIGITGDATWTSPTFDGTANVTAALTLASVITAGGPVGGAATVPVITYDAKGRLTAVATATITPASIGAQPAGSYASSSHNHTLDSLSNTTITSIATGELLRWNGTAWVNNTLAEAGIQPAGSYLTGNQTITLSGIVTGSGATSITTSIADAALSIAKTNGLQGALDARMATASYPDLTAIEALAGTSGLLRKIAANSWSLDTASYALSSAIPVASSTTPSALGTAAVGTGTTWARADHAHAMPTAAQVGAAAASHSHAIADVTALQSSLDGKQPSAVVYVSGSNYTSYVRVASITITAAYSTYSTTLRASNRRGSFDLHVRLSTSSTSGVVQDENAVSVGAGDASAWKIKRTIVAGTSVTWDIYFVTREYAQAVWVSRANTLADGTMTVAYPGNSTTTDPGSDVTVHNVWQNSIPNWNTAYGWGNHASAGYLTGNQNITLSGDATGSGATAIPVTITKINVLEHSVNNTEYPIVWDNNARALYHTASKMTWNPGLGNLTVSGQGSFDTLYVRRNTDGGGIKLGNDVFLGDVDLSYTLGIKGQADATQGYIKFGNAVYSLGFNGSNLVYGNWRVLTELDFTGLPTLSGDNTFSGTNKFSPLSGSGTSLAVLGYDGTLSRSSIAYSSVATGSGEANRMAYWSGTNALSSSSKLQFDGSNLLLGNTAGGLLTSLSVKTSNSIELICNARQALSTTGTSTLLDAAANITLAINGASKLSLSGGAISASNTIVPTLNNAYDLGSNTFRFANVHAANVFSGGNAVLTVATNSFAQNISFPSITITDKITCAFISINDSSTYILPDSDPVGTIRIVNGTPVAGWYPKVATSQYVYLTYSLADGSAYNEQGGIIPVPKRNYMFQKVASDRWCVLGVVS